MSKSVTPEQTAIDTPDRPANGPLLAMRRVSKSYVMGRTTLRVLSDCSLELADGEFVAIMGKSGSGKSTLLHLLGALDVPDDGQVQYRGVDVYAPPGQRSTRVRVFDMLSPLERRRIHLRRTQFGFVFQFYHLLPELNVLENVLLARMVDSTILGWPARKAAARADAWAMLDRVGLSERLRHRPNELSGGERQRVAIARALVHKPRILFADEPTGNLDAEAGANIMDLLADLHGDGQTIVLVTHDPGVAAYADRTLVLERGRLRPGAVAHAP